MSIENDYQQEQPPHEQVGAMNAEARERVRKLELENRILEVQASKRGQRIEWLKAYTSIGGLITAGIAALAFLASLYQISENYRRADASLEAERFGKALTLLSESRPAQRLSGVTYLASILPSRNYRSEAAATLANMIGLEDNVVVRRAIRDALIDFARSIDTTTQDRALLQQVLVQLSKTMASEHMDFLTTQEDTCIPTDVSGPCEAKKKLDAVASVLQAVVTKGSANKSLAGIFCTHCNFDNLRLDGFDFADAVLNNATFNSASLKGVSFKNASLVETDFSNAVLWNADFAVDAKENYVKRRFRIVGGKLDSGRFGPNFTCADLSGAVFSKHPIIRVHSSLQQKFFADQGPIFWWANLDGADFTHALAYGVTNQREGPFRVTMYGFTVATANEFYYAEWWLEPDSFLQIDETSPYWVYLNPEFAIINAHWESAKWPVGVRTLLERSAKTPLGPAEKWYGSGTAPPTAEAPTSCVGLHRGKAHP